MVSAHDGNRRMRMKLFNRTKIPDEVLAPFIVAASRRAGAKTQHMAVQVNPSRYRTHGRAFDCCRVRITRRGGGCGRWVRCSGYFEVCFPVNWMVGLNNTHRTIGDNKAVELIRRKARGVFGLCVHEASHIRDYQVGGQVNSTRSLSSGRRPKWIQRPEEIRAENLSHKAMKKIDSGSDVHAVAMIDGFVRAILSLGDRNEN